MVMELRKRKAPEPAPAVAPTKKKAPAKKGTKPSKEEPKEEPKEASKKEESKEEAKEEEEEKDKDTKETESKDTKEKETKETKETKAPAKKSKDDAASSGLPAVGSTIELDGFGGEIQTNDGETTTLKALVEASKAGVVLFTYPKASTPGCTKQACLFRDKYEPLTATGLLIYGLSTDSPKANTTFQTNQKLPYPLLCDPAATLIEAIGLKKQPKGTTRGVFVVDKTGKVLAAEPGSPDGTVAVVQKLVQCK